MPRPNLISHDLLQAALTGLETQKQKIEHLIAEVRAVVHGVSAGVSVTVQTLAHPPKRTGLKRTLSDEARKRIAAAQKKRWATFRKSTKKK